MIIKRYVTFLVAFKMLFLDEEQRVGFRSFCERKIESS